MDLLKAFSIQDREIVAVVGGGGKTSLMFALAEAVPSRVVLTTTTRIFAAQIKLATAVSSYTSTAEENWAQWLADLEAKISEHGHCLLVGEVEGEKAFGVPADLPAKLLAANAADVVIIEADGSRMRPIKAPAEHEPVIPAGTTLLVPVVGIDALNGRITDIAHRPERVQEVLKLSESITHLQPQDVAQLIVSAQGGLKNLPANARAIPLISKVESETELAAARQIAQDILRASTPAIPQVVLGAVKTTQPVRELHTRVMAVILAAGEGKRMGQTKQLLPWGDTTLVGQTIRHAQQSLAYDVLVVTGHEAEKIAAVAREAGAPTLHNADYAAGEMLSSLQTAVRALPDSVTAVLVMLADQPMVTPDILNQLLTAFWQGRGSLIAPQFNGQRGNPVLIGAAHFAELLQLPPGSAPRALFKKHQPALIAVASDAVLADLDTPQEYGRWSRSDED